MKTIFTLFASLLLSISLFAVPIAIGTKPASMLTVKSLDKKDIRVVVDGRRFEPGTSSVIINGVDAGYHTIKVYREKTNGLFSILGRKYEMVYNTSVSVKPRTNMSLTIDRLGRTTISETKIVGGNGRDNDWGHQRDDRDFDKNNDHEYDYDSDGKFGDYDTNYGYGKGMNDREFSQVLQAISKEWLETNKLKSATQIATANSLTSAQVKQLVLLFSFESNKLELAKQAYQNTVDKKNYSMINDVFAFNSSKEDLARFIRNFR
jgi:hypothetical protein